MALSDTDYADCRRHTGYGFFGLDTNPSALYWRYFREFAMLEYRMSHLRPEEMALLQDTYLPTLNTLEMSPASVGLRGDDDNLDTAKAAVWSWNTNEVADRISLYVHYRKMLCNLLQIQPGPFMTGVTNSVRMVV